MKRVVIALVLFFVMGAFFIGPAQADSNSDKEKACKVFAEVSGKLNPVCRAVMPKVCKNEKLSDDDKRNEGMCIGVTIAEALALGMVL